MIANKMNKTITEKETLIKELEEKLAEKLDLEIKTKNETTKILNETVWKTVYPNESRVTDKLKTAYVDKQLGDNNTQIKWLENDIAKIKRQIELCNDKISLYKYTLKELEITK